MKAPYSAIPKASLCAISLLAASALSAEANTVVFFDDFSSGTAAPQFSGAVDVVDAGGYKGKDDFADNFLWNKTGVAPGAPPLSTDLTLNGLATHTMMTIMFDLAMIDSWDGKQPIVHAPDFFNLTLDGFEIFEISVDNAQGRFNGFFYDDIPSTATQTVNEAALFGTTNTDGMGAFFDYDRGFSVSLTVAHSASSAALSFFADGSGYHSAFGALDESWAIDNVKVSTNAQVSAVPLPAAFPLLAGGLGLFGALGWRRRRKASAA